MNFASVGFLLTVCSFSSEPLYIDDLEDVLNEAMLSLNTMTEDGSIEEVSISALNNILIDYTRDLICYACGGKLKIYCLLHRLCDSKWATITNVCDVCVPDHLADYLTFRNKIF